MYDRRFCKTSAVRTNEMAKKSTPAPIAQSMSVQSLALMTGSSDARPRISSPPRRTVRLARDRISPCSKLAARTSGPSFDTTVSSTMPPSTTMLSPTSTSSTNMSYETLTTGQPSMLAGAGERTLK